jgi:hypothetical protein
MPEPQPQYPPPLYIGDGDARILNLHNYQIYDMVRGSGTGTQAADQLDVLDCTGSGPFYDVTLAVDDPHPDSGIDLVSVGDFLMIADDVDDSHTTSVFSWYRYDITEVLSRPEDSGPPPYGGPDNTQEGDFRVKYFKDTKSTGDQNPCDLYHTYIEDGYGSAPDGYMLMVTRRVNVDILLGDL